MKLGQFLNRQALKLVGLGFGIAVVIMVAGTMVYAYAEEPEFCGGCHSMHDSYVSWQASTHSTVACSDCHLPHDGLATELIAKVQSGLVDVYYEAKRDYPLQPKLSEKNHVYVQDNCLRCHEPVVRDTMLVSSETDCLSCHRSLVHKTD